MVFKNVDLKREYTLDTHIAREACRVVPVLSRSVCRVGTCRLPPVLSRVRTEDSIALLANQNKQFWLARSAILSSNIGVPRVP